MHVGYAPALAMRVTYVGELGWELHVPAEYGAGVYDDLLAAGADLGIRPVGLAAMSSLRLEKGYRDMGVDIDNTDNPIEAGLGFAVAWDKPGGFIGRDALLAARADGPAEEPGRRADRGRPETADLFGNEPVFLGGEWVGYVRAAAYGYTVGGPVALAQVACEDGVTAEWLKSGDFTVRTDERDWPARLQIAPFYDPKRLRILARADSRASSPRPAVAEDSGSPTATFPSPSLHLAVPADEMSAVNRNARSGRHTDDPPGSEMSHPPRLAVHPVSPRALPAAAPAAVTR